MERVQQVEIEVPIDGVNVRRKVEIEIKSTFRCRARWLRWRGVEGVVQHVLDDSFARATQVAVGRRRADPV